MKAEIHPDYHEIKVVMTDGTDIAGTRIEISNNTFLAEQTPVVIRGVPQDRCEVHHNWFPRHADAPAAVRAGAGTMVSDNLYGKQGKDAVDSALPRPAAAPVQHEDPAGSQTFNRRRRGLREGMDHRRDLAIPADLCETSLPPGTGR